MEAGALRRLTIGVRCRIRGVVFVVSFSWCRFRGVVFVASFRGVVSWRRFVAEAVR
jgi:hypothetical protein